MLNVLKFRLQAVFLSSPFGVIYSFLLGLLIRREAILNPTSVDWDEDGFISIGKMFATHGVLPFVGSYEHKPPLNYLFYSLPFISNLDSARFLQLFPLLIISCSGFFLSRAIKLQKNIFHQIATSLILIVCVSVLPSGLGWMTEINAILAISLAFWIIRFLPKSTSYFFWLGLTLSLLPFIRTNLGIPAFMLFLCYLVTNQEFRKKIHLVLLGCLIPPGLTSIPYLISGNTDALWNGMVQIHLVSDRFGSDSVFLIGKTRVLILSSVIVYLLLSLRENRMSSNCHSIKWIVDSLLDKAFILALGVSLSIFLDIPNYGHHLLQAAPILVFLLLRIASLFNNHHLLYVMSVVIFLSGLLSVQTEISQPRIQAAERTKSVVQCVERQLDSPTTAWVLNDIFLYWQTDLVPVDSLVIHPTTLMLLDFLEVFPDKPLTQTEGAQRILSKKPIFIVFSPKSWFLTFEIRQQLQQSLLKFYSKQNSCGISGLQIYKLKS